MSAAQVGTVEWYVEAFGDDAQFAQTSKAEATDLVHRFIGGASNPFDVPPTVLARAVLEVAADLYWRKASRNGIVTGLDSIESQPVRLNRDPMAAAYPMLRPYLVTGL